MIKVQVDDEYYVHGKTTATEAESVTLVSVVYGREIFVRNEIRQLSDNRIIHFLKRISFILKHLLVPEVH